MTHCPTCCGEGSIVRPCAARLVAPQSRRAIYSSQFDRPLGRGRIHPDAPLDLDRTDDGTREATAWRPPKKSHDWESDPRPFTDVLAEWVVTINSGRRYGARPVAAEALRVSLGTLDQWLKGRAPAHEKSFRLLMALITSSRS